MTVFLADPVESNRATAKWKRTTRYNTGQPCTGGHRADRYTCSGRCVECAREDGARHRNKLRAST
jgi:hypothetical protein